MWKGQTLGWAFALIILELKHVSAGFAWRGGETAHSVDTERISRVSGEKMPLPTISATSLRRAETADFIAQVTPLAAYERSVPSFDDGDGRIGDGTSTYRL
jgi:hypothetical protein